MNLNREDSPQGLAAWAWVDRFWSEEHTECSECPYLHRTEEKHGLPGPGETFTECRALEEGKASDCPEWCRHSGG